MNRFENKVAFVTGGGDGMGAASVKRLAAEGAVVYAFDKDGNKAQDVAKALQAQGKSVVAIQGSVTEPSELQAAFEQVDREQGRLDVLINVAGGSMAGYVCDLEISDWERLYRLNVLGTVSACRLAIERMRKNDGGAIVIMSSISGVGGDPGWAAYNTAKAALINLTECLAWEVGRDGIRVNAICPGPIASERMIASLPDPAAFTKAYDDSIALGRMGKPEEVAAAIVFLASDDASFITGAHLMADGGLTARTGQPIVPPS